MRTIWIVDGGYLAAFGGGALSRIDLKKLKQTLEYYSGGKFVSSHFFHSSDDVGRAPYFNWLRVSEPEGPQMITELYGLKDTRCSCPHCLRDFQRPVQKGVDVALATTLIRLAHLNVYDRVILTAGDGDFSTALSYVVRELGKQLWINGSQSHPHSRISKELRALSSNIVLLETLDVVRVRNQNANPSF